MPTPVQMAFEKLDHDIRMLEFDTSLKILALKQCDYLVHQTELPVLSRIPRNQLLHTWSLLLETLKRAAIYHFFEEKEYLALCANFCGDVYRQPKPKIKSEPEFFKEILRRIDRLSNVKAHDRWLMYLAIRALKLESELPKPKREQALLLPIWKMIFPRLKSLGLLNGLTSDSIVRDQIGFFLKGSYVESSDLVKRGRKYPDHDFSGKQGINPRHLPQQNEIATPTCEPTARQSLKNEIDF